MIKNFAKDKLTYPTISEANCTNTLAYDGTSDNNKVSHYCGGSLDSTTQNTIDTVVWPLGGAATIKFDRGNVEITSKGAATPEKFYKYEISHQVWPKGAGINYDSPSVEFTDDACPRTLFWTGKVGLIYPSDFGFAIV